MNAFPEVVAGVPLGDIQGYLVRAGIEVRRAKASLHYRANCGDVEIRVCDTDAEGPAGARFKAGVIARTVLSKGLPVEDPGLCAHFNRFAAMGALMQYQGRPCVVSRLVACDATDWNIHALLLAWAATFSADAMDPAAPARRAEREKVKADAGPGWPATDFLMLDRRLRDRVHCTGDDAGLAAEISLRGGAGTAAAGDDFTALISLRANEPHPALGPGLLAQLHLPHLLDSDAPLARVLRDLNAWEAGAGALVPHYGAWCPGEVLNPVYTSFIPRHLSRPDLAPAVVSWMMARARLADGFLLARGIVPGVNPAPSAPARPTS